MDPNTAGAIFTDGQAIRGTLPWFSENILTIYTLLFRAADTLMTDEAKPPLPLLLPLDHSASIQLSISGGKASTLARLHRLHFDVPDGFVVPAHAIWKTTLYSQIRATAEALFSTYASHAPEAAYIGKAPSLAVRSSVCCEDGAEASFAGQFQTCLNNVNSDAVVHAARFCRQSFDAYRVRAYAQALHKSHPDHEGASLSTLDGAVLVQRQVPAVWAGVCFSADPESGIEQLSIIEAVRGLAEDLVSGHRKPFHARMDRRSGHVVELRAPETNSLMEKAALTEFNQLAERVCTLGEEVRHALGGAPLDLEWAYDGDRIWILQARPVTTATFPLPERKPISEPELWFHGNFAETMPGPIPVLCLDAVRKCIPYFGIPEFAKDLIKEMNAEPIELLAGRVCWNISFLMGAGLINRNAIWLMKCIDARMVTAIERMLNKGELTRLHFPRGSSLGRRIGCVLFFYVGFHLAMFRAIRNAKPTAEGMRQAGEDLLTQIGNEPAETLTMKQAWKKSRELMAGFSPGLEPYVPAFFALYIPVVWATLAARWSGKPLIETLGCMDNLPSGTVLMERALRDLGVRLRKLSIEHGQSLETLPSGAAEDLQDFLETFGHRGPGEQDLSKPRLRETPALALELALCAAESNLEGTHPEHEAESGMTSGAQQVLFDSVKAKGLFGGLKVRFLKWLLPHAQRIAPIREDGKHLYWMPVNQRLRALLLRVGAVLAEHNELDCTEDIFHLKVDEIEEQVLKGKLGSHSMRERVSKRKAKWESWKTFEFPDVLRSDGRPVRFDDNENTDSGRWTGVAISNGIYEGPARVARTFDEARGLRPGEILVAVSVDPGWTPLYSRAGALVMEVGGVLSHGAVVAREMKLPAVAGIYKATSLINSGQRIEVNGRMGTVRLVEENGL